MDRNESIQKIINATQKAMKLGKCRKCECMKESLKSIKKAYTGTPDDLLSEAIDYALCRMDSIEYT